MKKLFFTFIATVGLFVSSQVTMAHADTTSHVEQYATDRKITPAQKHSMKSKGTKNENKPKININSMLSNWTEPQSVSSNSDNMIANLSPKLILTSDKHFKVPETDTIDGDGETTDPSKGYAMNHYTGDNVNGDAQTNDHNQPKQGQE